MVKTETFGQLLARLRHKAELTQEGLAGKAGLSLANVKNWEYDHRKPTDIGAVLALARALGVTVEELAVPLEKPAEPAPRRPRRRKEKA